MIDTFDDSQARQIKSVPFPISESYKRDYKKEGISVSND